MNRQSCLPVSTRPHPNHLRFCLGPAEAVSFTLDVKALGEHLVSRPTDFSTTPEAFGSGRAADPYERLLRAQFAEGKMDSGTFKQLLSVYQEQKKGTE